MGFYIGANAGYGSERKCWDFVSVAGVRATEGCHTADGAVAGGQIGYRWQSGSFVYGLEAQGDYANLRGSNVSTLVPAFTNRSRLDAFGLFTGQIGYAWNNVLLYAKGGAAVTSNRYDINSTITGANIASTRTTRTDATVGGGLEYGFTPNWSFGVEYDHIFSGTNNVPFATQITAERITGDVDMVTARINYKFGGPVVARY